MVTSRLPVPGPGAALLCAAILAACRAAEPPAADPPPPAAASAADPAPAADADDPDTCRPCHAAAVDAWGESMHARAHHDRDPIYAGVRKARMAKEGAEVARACERCHTPRAAAGEVAAARGVTCAACHLAEGASARGHTALAVPADRTATCMRCHAELHTPGGVPMCTTGVEWQAGPAAADQTCVGCHMPEVAAPSGAVALRPTHRSHSFAGPHRAWYQDDPTLLATAVTLTAERIAGKLSVRVTNRTGHGFPTGFPGRLARVVAEGFDAAGQPVWHSPADHAGVTFGKRYVDAAGEPTLAPWSVRLDRDSRLTAGETRAVPFTPPPEAVRFTVRVELLLLPATLAAKLGLADAPEAAPRTVATLELP